MIMIEQKLNLEKDLFSNDDGFGDFELFDSDIWTVVRLIVGRGEIPGVDAFEFELKKLMKPEVDSNRPEVAKIISKYI